jgi:hypothetical protein
MPRAPTAGRLDLQPDFRIGARARALFPEDIARQQLKLMDMIAAIVGALDKREIFQSLITYSGRQHAHYGVKRVHFVAFGDALIWGLKQQFGAAFTPELKQAWIKLYDAVQTEIRAARIGSRPTTRQGSHLDRKGKRAITFSS